jgi:DNA-binding CsgD family transcriptional regulator
MAKCGRVVDYPRVRELYESGFSMADVSKQTGHTKGCIGRYLRRIGVVRKDRVIANRMRLERTRGITPTQVVQLYADGKTLREVGQEFGVSADYVQDTLKRAGVPTRNRADSRRLAHAKRNGRCPRCKETKHVLSNGYCRPCFAEYTRERRPDAAPPKEYWQLEVSANLTATERMLLLRCAAAITDRHRISPEQILDKAGIPWRRQVTLMSCALAYARERGTNRKEAS